MKVLQWMLKRFRGERGDMDFEKADHRILFVCMGNICRSPTAEGVFRRHVELYAPDLHVVVDSAGTHAFHSGEPPDPRACRAAESRGIDLSRSRARRVADEDFTRFDLIVAMDKLNLTTLREQCVPDLHDRIRLLLEFTDRVGDLDVPDPYYGGAAGFERVLDLVEEGSRGLLEHLRTRAR
jgi:protein-tyrosine phosphatase